MPKFGENLQQSKFTAIDQRLIKHCENGFYAKTLSNEEKFNILRKQKQKKKLLKTNIVLLINIFLPFEINYVCFSWNCRWRTISR
jgi:hypothetical protein